MYNTDRYNSETIQRTNTISARKATDLMTGTANLLLSFLFPELNALLLSPTPHLFRIQRFVLVAVHPVVVFGRTG